MFNIHPLYAKECIYSINFLNMLTVVLIKNFKEEIFEEISNVRCNGNKLNPEIFDFFKRMGGTKKVYDYFLKKRLITKLKKRKEKIIWNFRN